ncbi:MAG TPA: endo alpha-1,4 polygalactosaminidase, partial [Kribbella sp.]|nr:endo alpha-1,4 polygalactosaminidase [Kribbella sp.]
MSRLTRRLHVAAAATALAVTVPLLIRTPADAAVTLPPTHAKFDYQIGGAYTPPAGVQVVTRDRTAAPAAGLYNICYVNAFQVQPGEQGDWAADLLLRDAAGNLVIDEDWGEPLLDLRTADKRSRIAAKVNGWIDGCATKGYQAIEPDNYDSYTRSKNLLTPDQAKAFHTVIATHAHAKNLAIGQKNTVELAGDRQAVGLDFAVAEECGQYDECGDYVDAFGNNVIVIEYTDKGRR